MEHNKLLYPGNHIEVRITQQVNDAKDTGELVKCYISDIFDLGQDESFEINMPSEQGKLILFPVNIRLDLVIFTKNGLVGCQVDVIDRYKKDNFYLLKVKPVGKVEKIQRREFYRLNCTLDVTYYQLDEDAVALEDPLLVLQEIKLDEKYYLKEKMGVAVDISGGGLRFRGREPLEEGSNLLVIIPVKQNGETKEFKIVSHVIASAAMTQNPGTYENRLKFIFSDSKQRECIVRYIFEEERRLRKKENG